MIYYCPSETSLCCGYNDIVMVCSDLIGNETLAQVGGGDGFSASWDLNRKESLFYLTSRLEHIDFHIIT